MSGRVLRSGRVSSRPDPPAEELESDEDGLDDDVMSEEDEEQDQEIHDDHDDKEEQEEEQEEDEEEEDDDEDDETFATLKVPLDKRLTKAVAKCGFVRPTLVQAKTLPLALAGKDLLVRARTGSGKTLAFLLPVLQKILSAKEESSHDAIRAVILAPTRELVSQIDKQLAALLYYCRDMIRSVALGSEAGPIQEAWLKSLPDIVVATPGRLAAHLKKKLQGALQLRQSVETLVVDEADLIFSFGYSDDVTSIVSHLPKTCQSFLMSATLNADVLKLKKLVLHSPVVVKLEEGSSDGTLAQWYMEVPENDKDVLLYALMRLKLISGKTLFFVNSIERCYRTKLLLEQFHIKSAVLNSELPLNSRLHILEQFNRGVFDNLIATDEALTTAGAAANSDDEEDDQDEEKEEEEEEDSDEQGSSPEGSDGASDSEKEDEEDAEEQAKKDVEKDQGSKKRKRPTPLTNNSDSKDENQDEAGEFGVARGVDFRGVATVINLDLPSTVESYTHRIGRTARGGASGTALSIVCSDKPEEMRLLEKVQQHQPRVDGNPSPALLALDVKEIQAFKYRVEDVRRAVTKVAVRDARLREIKLEMLNSKKLRAHFEDNPNDLNLLRHDADLRPSKVQRHLGHIPTYLLPKMMADQGAALSVAANSEDAKAPYGRSTSGRRRWQERHRVGKFRSKASINARRRNRKGGWGHKKRRDNPLF